MGVFPRSGGSPNVGDFGQLTYDRRKSEIVRTAPITDGSSGGLPVNVVR